MQRLHARYPFLSGAREAVEAADVDLVSLVREGGPAVERGVERVRRALLEGTAESEERHPLAAAHEADAESVGRNDGPEPLSTSTMGTTSGDHALGAVRASGGAAYAADRLDAAGFEGGGPTLLTGVDAAHARCARAGPVTVLATAGLSNPARLPVHPKTTEGARASETSGSRPAGTINLLVATTRALSDGTLATLLGTAVEAKTATVQAATGFSGTTTDAVAVGSDPAGEPADFAGSTTDVGAAARVCVRDAVLAALDARGGDLPERVDDANHGVVTSGRAEVFEP